MQSRAIYFYLLSFFLQFESSQFRETLHRIELWSRRRGRAVRRVTTTSTTIRYSWSYFASIFFSHPADLLGGRGMKWVLRVLPPSKEERTRTHVTTKRATDTNASREGYRSSRTGSPTDKSRRGIIRKRNKKKRRKENDYDVTWKNLRPTIDISALRTEVCEKREHVR